MKFSIALRSAAITTVAVVLLSQPTLLEGRSTCPDNFFNPEAQLRYYGGFNLGLHNPDMSCKLPHHWQHEFEQLSAAVASLELPQVVFKLFSTSDCGGFFKAIPAAINTNTKVWATLWTGHGGRYEQEKEALRQAIQAFPHAHTWLAGISVGSEHLHRGEMSAWEISSQICDIKQMVQYEFGLTGIPVGCADTGSSLALPYNQQAMWAADHVNVNTYPFWSQTHIDDAQFQMTQVLRNFRDLLADDPDKVIAFGETGWPSVGVYGASFGDVPNAERYWKDVGCWMHKEKIPWVWFEGVDEPNKPDMGCVGGAEQNWGVLKAGANERKFEMIC
ncbi:glycoside hydrolase [Terfezia boudieri ATCC MYA-4762]|uniref:glucan endo-1,3-beta-D-glucosidase n=1 Tax=Terfezia boudieri ATCC MYA-4762 TaxID=1051890 RepID=A0A3N4M0T0_9PEZI|nr:glycoside hydrolase [Terfezia boudieri ATCC MYA-4762]